jgi:hypothetical protein
MVRDAPSALLTMRMEIHPTGVRLLIRVDDLAAGREPDAIVLLHLGERALEIVRAQRLG